MLPTMLAKGSLAWTLKASLAAGNPGAALLKPIPWQAQIGKFKELQRLEGGASTGGGDEMLIIPDFKYSCSVAYRQQADAEEQNWALTAMNAQDGNRFESPLFLVSINPEWNFTYDAEGNRISKDIYTNVFLDFGGSIQFTRYGFDQKNIDLILSGRDGASGTLALHCVKEI